MFCVEKDNLFREGGLFFSPEIGETRDSFLFLWLFKALPNLVREPGNC